MKGKIDEEYFEYVNVPKIPMEFFNGKKKEDELAYIIKNLSEDKHLFEYIR